MAEVKCNHEEGVRQGRQPGDFLLRQDILEIHRPTKTREIGPDLSDKQRESDLGIRQSALKQRKGKSNETTSHRDDKIISGYKIPLKPLQPGITDRYHSKC